MNAPATVSQAMLIWYHNEFPRQKLHYGMHYNFCYNDQRLLRCFIFAHHAVSNLNAVTYAEFSAVVDDTLIIS